MPGQLLSLRVSRDFSDYRDFPDTLRPTSKIRRGGTAVGLSDDSTPDHEAGKHFLCSTARFEKVRRPNHDVPRAIDLPNGVLAVGAVRRVERMDRRRTRHDRRQDVFHPGLFTNLSLTW